MSATHQLSGKNVSIDLKGAQVLLWGGNGFFGKTIQAALLGRGVSVTAPPKNHIDLLEDDMNSIYDKLGRRDFDYCIHAAAESGGLIWNKNNPAEIYSHNLEIGIKGLRAAVILGCKKTLWIATSCSYPQKYEIMYEEDFHEGLPHESVRSFGMAKRSVDIYAKAMNAQYGANIATLCVTNLFGPGDSLDLVKTKFVGALIVKFLRAKTEGLPQVELLGDGTPLRDLLYVEDAAEYVVDALEKYDDYSLPLNIGSGEERSIQSVAMSVADLVGYEGQIVFQGDERGQLRKTLDISRMRQYLGEGKNTPFEEALMNTIEDYRLRLGI